MTLPASDNFDRANVNPIGGSWTTAAGLSAMKIVSQAALSASGDGAAFWNADAFAQNHYAACKVNGNDGGPVCRGSADGIYLFSQYPAYEGIWKVTGAGVWTQLAVLSFAYTSANVIRMEATGSAATMISVYKDGVLQGSVVDSSSPFTSGSPGMYAYDVTTLDDWEGGNLANPLLLRAIEKY